MARDRRPSKQMLALVRELYAQAPEWSHGYDLMKSTGILSGTLYPLLMRMTDQALAMPLPARPQSGPSALGNLTRCQHHSDGQRHPAPSHVAECPLSTGEQDHLHSFGRPGQDVRHDLQPRIV